MSAPRIATIVTTTNSPTPSLHAISKVAVLRGDMIVIGDAATPKNFALEGASYFDLSAQGKMPFAFAAQAPQRHYSRKNLGYLEAIARGAAWIVETDDDNAPIGDRLWDNLDTAFNGEAFFNAGWVNIYRRFTSAPVWPRGLPTKYIDSDLPTPSVISNAFCPVHQTLANGDPDVDAIYRLTDGAPIEFEGAPPLALGARAWAPFNSQCTRWHESTFALLYLPATCTMRMTDTWRGLVAKRILDALGWPLLFLPAAVRQDRNAHDLTADLRQEMPGLKWNAWIVETLQEIELSADPALIGESMRLCYAPLVSHGLLLPEELALLNCWLADIANLKSGAHRQQGRSPADRFNRDT